MSSEQELKALASQFKHPTGEKGIEIANMMNETNIGMTAHAIRCLDIQRGNAILELGHGNGGHINYLLHQSKNLRYCGLEISELMHAEAKRINDKFIANKQADFYLYDGERFPFLDNFFDRIFTVNTIYFWEKPTAFLFELYRVLKPGGKLCITFAMGNFMRQLPFTQYGFELYDVDGIKKLIDSASLKIAAVEMQAENVKSKVGEMVEREFTTIIIGK